MRRAANPASRHPDIRGRRGDRRQWRAGSGRGAGPGGDGEYPFSGLHALGHRSERACLVGGDRRTGAGRSRSGPGKRVRLGTFPSSQTRPGRPGSPCASATRAGACQGGVGTRAVGRSPEIRGEADHLPLSQKPAGNWPGRRVVAPGRAATAKASHRVGQSGRRVQPEGESGTRGSQRGRKVQQTGRGPCWRRQGTGRGQRGRKVQRTGRSRCWRGQSTGRGQRGHGTRKNRSGQSGK